MLKYFNCSTLFYFYVFNLFWLITTMQFIPAPEISTKKSNKYLCALFYFYFFNLFLFKTTVRFISAPEKTTTEGKIRANVFDI